MAAGIPLATAAVLRASAVDAAPETSPPPASPLITAEGLTASGTPLAPPGAPPEAWEWCSLHDQGRFAGAPVSAARTSADPLSAVPLLLDRIRVIPRSGHLGMRDSHRAHICLVARASIPLAATTHSATGDLAVVGVGTETVGAGTATEDTAGAAMAGTEAIGRDTTTTVGEVAFLERASAGVGALAWAGRIGAAIGDRAGLSAGTPGGTTLIGIRPGPRTTTTRIILTSVTTIRRLMPRMLCLTTTRRRAT